MGIAKTERDDDVIPVKHAFLEREKGLEAKRWRTIKPAKREKDKKKGKRERPLSDLSL